MILTSLCDLRRHCKCIPVVAKLADVNGYSSQDSQGGYKEIGLPRECEMHPNETYMLIPAKTRKSGSIELLETTFLIGVITFQ